MKKPILIDPSAIKNDSLALIGDNDKVMTYGELMGFCSHFSNHVPKRSLIFILCDNSLEAVAGYLACIEHKIVPLLLDSNLDNEFLRCLIEDYDPEFLWMPSNFQLVHGTERVTEFEEFSLYKRNAKKKDLHEDLALLLSTSGSTGSPKLVRHSYRNIVSSASNVSSFFDLTCSDRGFLMLPMSYTMGLSVINSHIRVGGIVLVTRKQLGDRELWDLMRIYEATNFTGVPFSFEFMDRIGFMKMDYPNLRILAQGGGRMKSKLFKKYAEYCVSKGMQFFATYGQTEGTARMSFLTPQMATKKTCSIGKGMPQGVLDLVDSKGSKILTPNVEGELVFSGPNVTMGYSSNLSDLKKGDENKGLLFTGDIAYFDQDGFFYIVGRKKRFVKHYSERISLDHLENKINDKFDVQCVCTGNDAKICIRISNMELKQAIQSFVSMKLKIRKTQFDIFPLDHIEVNSFGKIIY